MEVDFETITLHCSRNEVVALYHGLKRDVEHAIDTHWVNYPNTFLTGEDALPMLQKLAPYAYRDWADELARFEQRIKDKAKPGVAADCVAADCTHSQ